MPYAPQIDAPISLGNFFPDSSDEESESIENGGDGGATHRELDQCYETQNVDLCGMSLRVRQYAFHSHNANRVWPGTFNLAEYLLREEAELEADGGEGKGERSAAVTSAAGGDGRARRLYARHWGSTLELGTATGLLAIRMALAAPLPPPSSGIPTPQEGGGRGGSGGRRGGPPPYWYACSDVTTSDVDDDGGGVEENVRNNFAINGFAVPAEVGGDNGGTVCDDGGGSVADGDSDGKNRPPMPIHVPHTWGTGWVDSASKRGVDGKVYDTIIASDILLYVSAYPALVQTLTELFKMAEAKGKSPSFVMSWNRRMKASAEFFDLMLSAGFKCRHQGKCVYTFQM